MSDATIASALASSLAMIQVPEAFHSDSVHKSLAHWRYRPVPSYESRRQWKLEVPEPELVSQISRYVLSSLADECKDILNVLILFFVFNSARGYDSGFPARLG